MYLLDTVAVIRHFTGSGEIGRNAKLVFDNFINSTDEFSISVISLMEIMYLSEKNRISIDLTKTLSMILETERYRIIDLNYEIIKTATQIEFYELHDRMIIATAKWLGIPIISSDSLFSQVKNLEVIWD